jgi:DNA repair protein RadC
MTDNERPHYLGHRQRLRERFVKNGIAGLADYELMELVLTLWPPQRCKSKSSII